MRFQKQRELWLATQEAGPHMASAAIVRRTVLNASHGSSDTSSTDSAALGFKMKSPTATPAATSRHELPANVRDSARAAPPQRDASSLNENRDCRRGCKQPAVAHSTCSPLRYACHVTSSSTSCSPDESATCCSCRLREHASWGTALSGSQCCCATVTPALLLSLAKSSRIDWCSVATDSHES